MSKFAKVKEHSNLVRDLDSKAVLNVDNKSLQAYRESRNARMKQQQKFEGIQEEIDSIRDDITEIKSLLLKIVKD